MYDQGYGVPQDYAEAMKWFRKAAEQGDADAQYNLGVMHAQGYGVPQDFVLAHMWATRLDQTLPQAGERPSFDLLGRRQRPQKIRQIVGQRVELEPHGVGFEPHAGEPGPFEGVLALLDVLLRRTPVVVKRQ